MKSSFVNVVCLGMACLCSLTSFADAEPTNYSLSAELVNRGINPRLALVLLGVVILLRWNLLEQIKEKMRSRSFWGMFFGMLAIVVTAGIALIGLVPNYGIYPILACLVATFTLLHICGKSKYDMVAANALLLIILLSIISVPDGFGGTQKGPLCVGIGIAIFAIYDTIVNLTRSHRKKSCLAKIVALNKKRAIEDEVSPITADDGKTYCIVGLDDGKQIAVNVNCRPDKRGYYKCAWIWNDPKDGQCSFITPDNYQILFNPDTGDIQMLGLKNINDNQMQKED